MDVTHWYPSKGMDLKHPCVGLVQHAFWWGKTKEMLILKKVMQSLPDVHFYWVGFGQYQDRILQELSSFDNFHWLGKFSWEEYPENIRQFFTEIDVYALPTGMDAAPLSCKEAMAMQNPVIATNVGGIPEIIENQKNGILISPENPSEMTQAINELLENPLLIEKLTQNAFDFITKNFTWDTLIKKYIELYEK